MGKEGLMYQLSNGGRKDPFPTDEKSWSNPTDTQLESWKQAALERDASDNVIVSEIVKKRKQVNDLLKEIYGDSRNYKGKPIDYASKLGDKILKYLSRDDNSPLLHWSRSKWEDKYNRLYARLQQAKQDAMRLEITKQKEREKATAQQQQLMQLGIIANRHGIPLEKAYSPDALLCELATKDKYLNLAIAGQETRNDWSDGFYRVEYAFRDFKVETDVDKAIYEDYAEILNEAHEDGRIFRDTTYSYDKLYDFVSDKQLLTDAMELMEMSYS